MTSQDKINYIISAIQADATLIKVLRVAISNQLLNVTEDRLDVLIAVINSP